MPALLPYCKKCNEPKSPYGKCFKCNPAKIKKYQPDPRKDHAGIEANRKFSKSNFYRHKKMYAVRRDIRNANALMIALAAVLADLNGTLGYHSIGGELFVLDQKRCKELRKKVPHLQCALEKMFDVRKPRKCKGEEYKPIRKTYLGIETERIYKEMQVITNERRMKAAAEKAAIKEEKSRKHMSNKYRKKLPPVSGE